jgi:hypothetical protein
LNRLNLRLFQPFALCSLLLLLGLVACQPANQNISATVTPISAQMTLAPTPLDVGWLAPPGTPDLTKLPLLAAHVQAVQQILSTSLPILPLSGDLTDEQKQAQTLALQDQRFQKYIYDAQLHRALRSEIFGIYPMRDSDITPATTDCQKDTCYRVEMYNYALNLTQDASVDLTTSTVLSVSEFADTQPDIPTSLTQIALEIAANAPEVKEALGFTPSTEAAVMAETKTSLNGTRCERSQHLCVAPTFVSGDRALWAIVDLTDGRLIGLRWTQVGETGPAVSPDGSEATPFVTEKGLENDVMMRDYCEHNTALDQDGWQMNYILTSSDGLRISDVSFQGKPILESAKLVDWHVSYSHQDGFGYSDAVGCPVFSQAAVIAVQPPIVEPIRANGQVVGFALQQDFWSELWPRPCNYYYEQRYEFYLDGRFRPIVSSFGRGCGNDGTYRPVTRIVLSQPSTFAEWSGSDWKDWTQEGWRLQDDLPVNPQGYQYRVTDSSGAGFYIEPGQGQFGDGGRGDHAYTYVTVHHPDIDEGDADMSTIGPCCNTDFHQGPEKFINPTPETVTNTPLVLWYVAQLKNDDQPDHQYCWAESILVNGVYQSQVYPCVSGPMFVPTTPQHEATLTVTDTSTDES